MSFVVLPPLQDARQVVFELLSDPDTGVSIYADNLGTNQAPPLNAGKLASNGMPPNSYTEGPIVVAKAPFKMEGQGPLPQVVVAHGMGSREPMTFPPIWQDIDDVVLVKIFTREWDGNDRGFKLTGDVARTNLVLSVVGIILANYSNPDGQGTWNWMRPLNNGVPDDHWDEHGLIYNTNISIGLRRFAQTT